LFNDKRVAIFLLKMTHSLFPLSLFFDIIISEGS